LESLARVGELVVAALPQEVLVGRPPEKKHFLCYLWHARPSGPAMCSPIATNNSPPSTA
jgi:hypothetical protein